MMFTDSAITEKIAASAQRPARSSLPRPTVVGRTTTPRKSRNSSQARNAQPAGLGAQPRGPCGSVGSACVSGSGAWAVSVTSDLLAEQAGRSHEEHDEQHDEDDDAVAAGEDLRRDLGAELLDDADGDAADERTGQAADAAEHRRGERGDERGGSHEAGGDQRGRREQQPGDGAEAAGEAPREGGDAADRD